MNHSKFLLGLSLIISIMINQSIFAQWELGVLHSFNGTNGATSKGSLTLVGNTLYGRTSAGGSNGEGVIFKLNTDSTGFQVLYNFHTGSSNGFGKEPHHDAMLLVDTILFGTALYGGNNDNGVIYKINLSGGIYDTVHVFTGGSNDGSQPHSGVILIGNVLYGITAAGGDHNDGTLYCINSDGSDFSVLHSFHSSTGDDSHGRLTLNSNGSQLLGMTKTGGSSNLGVIFSYDLTDSNYNVLHSFEGGDDDGSSTDHGFVTISGDTIFGMTQYGGTSDEGVVFSMNGDGTNFKILHSFGSSTNDGVHPFGSLTLYNGFLYGTTREGGVNDDGTIFRISTNGTIYQILFSLKQETSGENPIDNVIVSPQGKVYCLSQAGGINDTSGVNQYGAVFSVFTLGSISIKNITTEIPQHYKLSQNYPNPFNPFTRIKFEISKQSPVKLDVYDVNGRLIETLVNQQLNAGIYEVDFESNSLASGIYYYRIEVNGYSGSKRMVLLK